MTYVDGVGRSLALWNHNGVLLFPFKVQTQDDTVVLVFVLAVTVVCGVVQVKRMPLGLQAGWGMPRS